MSKTYNSYKVSELILQILGVNVVVIVETLLRVRVRIRVCVRVRVRFSVRGFQIYRNIAD